MRRVRQMNRTKDVVLNSSRKSMCENPEEVENWSIRKIERHSSLQLQYKEQGGKVMRKTIWKSKSEKYNAELF